MKPRSSTTLEHNTQWKKFIGIVMISMTCSTFGAFAYKVNMPRPDGVFQTYDRISLSVTVNDDSGRKVDRGIVEAVVDDECGFEFKRCKMDLSKGNPFVLELTSETPVIQRLTLKSEGEKDFIWGVAFSPDAMRRSGREPEDFDEFWHHARIEYDRTVPNDFTLERIDRLSDSTANVYRVSLTTPHGYKVDGILSEPADLTRGPFPALLGVPGAGHSKGVPKDVRDRGSMVSMLMNVHFYPLVVGETGGGDSEGARELDRRETAENAAYREKYGVKRYCQAGIGISREDYHYYDVILAHDRMINCLLARKSVDKSNVGYIGSSQGGGFGLILSGLNGRITRTVASVPALCNLLAEPGSHLPSGWPQLVAGQPMSVRETARRNAGYFDAVNFAARIRNPVRVVVGLSDPVCQPAGIWIAYSAIPAEDKKIIPRAGMGHEIPPEYEDLAAWATDRRRFRDEADYLKRKFREDTSDPKTGLDTAALQDGARQIAEEWKERETWQEVKSRMLAYFCDNIAIDCSGYDWFPSFASWKHFNRPLKIIVAERNQEIDRKFLPEESRAIRDALRTGRFSMWKDFDHSAPDWDTVLAMGWPGLERRLRAHWKDAPYYRALGRSVDAVKRLLSRLETCARNRSETVPAGSVAHKRLCAQADALAAIRTAPPSNAYEVMMFQFTYFYICERLDRMQVRSLGNVDRLLTPYYRADIAAGRTTRAEFKEQLVHFWWQWGSFDNYMGQPIWIGGTKATGETEYNEVTDIVLEVHDELALPSPKMIVKVAENTPKRYMDKMMDMVRRHRSMVFVGEETIAKILKGWRGCTDEECRCAEMNGCYEFYVRGEQNITQSSHISFVQPVADVLARATGEGTAADSFEDFMRLYADELMSNTRECVRLTDRWEEYLAEVNPGNINSLTVESSVKSGKDAYCNGYRFNDTALLSVGLGTAVDALLAVKEIVYEKRLMSLGELGGVMAVDWCGHEDLRRRMLRSKRKWGVNDPEANELGRRVAKMVSDYVNKRPNARGGIWGFSGHCANQFIDLARYTGATPDGRKAHDEVSKNLSPTPGADSEGVSAMVNTFSVLDPVDFPVNFPIDVMLHPSAVQGQAGLDAMEALSRVYFANGGTSVNFNVFDAGELKDAQKHPEKYENLQVRVCGWNVRWNFLSKAEQDAYIRRVEGVGMGGFDDLSE